MAELGLKIPHVSVTSRQLAFEACDPGFARVDVGLKAGEDVVEQRAPAFLGLQSLEIGGGACARLVEFPLRIRKPTRGFCEPHREFLVARPQCLRRYRPFLTRSLELRGRGTRGRFHGRALLLQGTLQLYYRCECRSLRGAALRKLLLQLLRSELCGDAFRAHGFERALVLGELLDLALEPILHVAQVGRQRAQVGFEFRADVGARAGTGVGCGVSDGGCGNFARDTQSRWGNNPRVSASHPLFGGARFMHRHIEHGKLGS